MGTWYRPTSAISDHVFLAEMKGPAWPIYRHLRYSCYRGSQGLRGFGVSFLEGTPSGPSGTLGLTSGFVYIRLCCAGRGIELLYEC
jgi:hypothetical protein